MDEKTSLWWSDILKKMDEWYISQNRLAVHLGISKAYFALMKKGVKPLSEEMKENIEKMVNRLNPNRPLSLLIDYVRIRFPVTDEFTVAKVLDTVLHIPFENFEQTGRGWNSYDTMYQYGEIYVCTSKDESLGMLLEMKGQGCRQFELYLEYMEWTWFDFFEHVCYCDGIYKRLDLAINDHYGILDIGFLMEKCNHGECISLSRKFSTCASGELRHEKSEMGQTLYIGTRQSEIYFCIYEKDYEQYEKYGEDIETAVIKNRFEIRLSDERAEEAVAQLVEHRWEDDGVEQVVFGIVNNYIRFAKADWSKPKREWQNEVMWEHFIGAYRDKLRLATDPIPFSERRSLNWLSHQCMPTLKGFMVKDIQRGTNIIGEMIENTIPSPKLKKVLELEEEIVNQIKIRVNKQKGSIDYGIKKDVQ